MENDLHPESRRLSAMCCGKAAKATCGWYRARAHRPTRLNQGSNEILGFDGSATA